jgi:hypothetical protein
MSDHNVLVRTQKKTEFASAVEDATLILSFARYNCRLYSSLFRRRW